MDTSCASGDAAFEINVASCRETFACNPGQTLLRTGLAAGHNVPHECASGSCGACRCTIVEGTVDALWEEAPGLSRRDRRKGNVALMCQSIPSSDLTIEVNLRGELPTPRPMRMRAELIGKRVLTEDMVELLLAPEKPMPFSPGQFLLLDTCDGRRAYSMSNVSQSGQRLELIVKRKPDGAVSPDLCDGMEIGCNLTIEGPYGAAYLREDCDRQIVAIAGGSGLGPMWSVVRKAAERGRTVALYFGVNREVDRCYESEFAQLAQAHPNFTHQIVVREAEGGEVRKGLVGDSVVQDCPDLSQADVYMAGPPVMVDTVVRQLMSECQVNCDRVFFDRFA